MDDYKVLLGAILDANAKNDIGNQLKAMKDLSVTISKANLDPSVINNIKQQLSKNGIDLTLVFGNQAQIQNQAKQAGQQIGNQIQSGINNVVQKGSFEKIFKADKINDSAKEAENYFKTLSNNVSVLEKFGQNNNLTSFTVSLKNAEGITEQLKYRIDNLKDDAGNITDTFFRYTGGSINDNGVIQQFNAISSKADELKIKLEDLKANYSDVNSPKAIKEPEHINALAQQYDKVNNAISSLRGADDSTFSSMQSNVKVEISALENLISQFRNAEYAATSLRSKDIATIKIDEGYNIDAFVEKMKQSGHYTSELESKVNKLRTDLASVFDKNSLTNYLNQMSNLQSEFKAVDAAAKTLEKDTKLQVNIDSEKSMLIAYGNELKESGMLSDEIKEKMQSMYKSLGHITTQTGLTTWRAELKGVKADADDLVRSINEVKKNQHSLDVGDYETKILEYETSLTNLGLSEEYVSGYMNNVNNAFTELKRSAVGDNIIPDDVVANAKILDDEMQKLSNTVKQIKLKDSLKADDLKVESTVTRLNEQLRKNSAYSKEAKQQIRAWLDELNKGGVAEARLKEINVQARSLHANMAQLNKIGFSWTDKLKNTWEKFGGWSLVTGAMMAGVSQIKSAVSELKELDNILTEITKTSDLTKQQLKELGEASLDVASKYGRKASDYLTAVQEMSRAGYEASEGMSKLSLLAQSAGDLSTELANDYLIASDAAFGYAGNVQKLNALLDGQNQVTNRNAVSMEELANATKVAGNLLANTANLKENQVTALLGTGIATSRESGETVARAIKSIIMNLQQVKGEGGFDGEIIDEEQLAKVEKRCHSVGVELEYMRDGIATLKNPIEILKELSDVYNSLPVDSAERAGIVSDIGGKYRANVLSSILSNWDKYEKMLGDYSNSGGSAMEEAMKSANNWEGSLNRLSNAWVEFIDKLTNQDAIIDGINLLSKFVNGITDLTDKIGGLSLAGTAIGAGLGVKNLGSPQMHGLLKYAHNISVLSLEAVFLYDS